MRGAVAVGVAFLAVQFAFGVSGPWLWLTIPAVIVAGASMPPWTRLILWAAQAALTAALVIPPALFEDEAWHGLRLPCYLAVTCGVLASGLWLRPFPLLWALASAIGAVLLYRAGIASYALLAAALAVSLFAAGLLSRDQSNVRGAVAVTAALHPALMAAGCFNHFSDVPTWVFVVVALAPTVAFTFRAREPGRGRET
jgi:hypothetical protein